MTFKSGGELLLHGVASGSVFGPARDSAWYQLPPGPHLAHLHLQQALQCLSSYRPCGQCHQIAPHLIAHTFSVLLPESEFVLASAHF